MLVRVLGSHKLEDRHARHTCFLIDNVLAVDAGSLSSSLTAAEQGQVKAVLLTHCHLDHIRDLPTLGLSTLHTGNSIDVWALPETLTAIHENFLNGEIYPDLTESLGSSPAKYYLYPICPEVVFKVLQYQVKPLLLPHTVANVGYIIRSEDGGCIGYTGDTRGGLAAFFNDSWQPQVLFVDVSFPNYLTELAEITGHLTPGMLRKEVLTGLEHQSSLPQIVPVHVSQFHEEEISAELQQVAAELGLDLVMGYEEMVLELLDSGCKVMAREPSQNESVLDHPPQAAHHSHHHVDAG